MSSFESNTPKVLSVQSSVVSGYVGNRASMFPLQLLGFDVDCINSVQFSNHTGYPVIQGTVLKGEELAALSQGLSANHLIDYDYLLTGYIGSKSFLEEVLNLLNMLEESKPIVKYICDPVLGDEGKFYVPEDMVEIFRVKVIPRAYMVTPNQFEASALSKTKIDSESDLLKAMKILTLMGPKIVVVTSSSFSEFPEQLSCYIMSNNGDSSVDISRINIPKLKGTGDVSAALLLAWTHIYSEKIPPYNNLGSDNILGESLLNTVETVQAILKRTIDKKNKLKQIKPENLDEKAEISFNAKITELSLIESRFDIMNPPRNLNDSSCMLKRWSESLLV